MKLTEDNFDELYVPIQNHLVDDASFDGTMFETYGEELDFVFSVSQAENTNKTVWTIIEADGKMYCASGFHIVNRMGYIITEKPWETGEEEFTYEGVEDEHSSYIIYKDEYSDREFYDLINVQFDLPEYNDLFDLDGEVCEDYKHFFAEGTSVEVLHENIRISDIETLQKFLLEDAKTTNEIDEAIKEVLFKHNGKPFQLSGDGDSLGFTLDIWENQEDLNDGEEAICSEQFWFEDYED